MLMVWCVCVCDVRVFAVIVLIVMFVTFTLFALLTMLPHHVTKLLSAPSLRRVAR